MKKFVSTFHSSVFQTIPWFNMVFSGEGKWGRHQLDKLGKHYMDCQQCGLDLLVWFSFLFSKMKKQNKTHKKDKNVRIEEFFVSFKNSSASFCLLRICYTCNTIPRNSWKGYLFVMWKSLYLADSIAKKEIWVFCIFF